MEPSPRWGFHRVYARSSREVERTGRMCGYRVGMVKHREPQEGEDHCGDEAGESKRVDVAADRPDGVLHDPGAGIPGDPDV